MNWLGKVFVVVIVILSLMFMGLAMGVYATHKNWQQVAEKLNSDLSKAKAENSRLVTEHNQKVEELERENTAHQQEAVKLEAERVALVQRNQQIQSELDGLKQNQRDHIAAVAATQAINQGLATEVSGLRQQIRTAQQDRDKLFKTALDATEQLHEAAGEYNATLERNRQLVKQVAGKDVVMRENGINPNTNPNSVVPTVEGVVSKIERKPGGQLVEVTIGADDGLKTGNTLEVSRGDRYLGRVEIIETSPDKSVARVDRRFQQGQIQEGDRVATRIRL
jgi:predicted  nucleic acid-binding Zn-ribbon protein